MGTLLEGIKLFLFGTTFSPLPQCINTHLVLEDLHGDLKDDGKSVSNVSMLLTGREDSDPLDSP